jgi:hypothetical protein
MCKLAVFGEGLRILEWDWRIVKLASAPKLPICSTLVWRLAYLGSLGLAILVLEVGGEHLIMLIYIWCLVMFICFFSCDYKNSRIYFRIFYGGLVI